MQIAGYLKTSLIEWSGKITSVVFTSGCNFRCPFCHNADLVEDKIRESVRINEKEMLADLKSRKRWVDAVVITGGEPTLQNDLEIFLEKVKKLGFKTMVHTNGSRPEVIEKLIENKLVDYWAMDLKGDMQNYNKYTNVQCPISNIKKSMESIIDSGAEFEFRTTVVPGLHDLKNLKKLARQIILKPKTLWFLQQFQPMNTYDKKYLKIKPFLRGEMENFQKELQKIIPQILLRGV